jgi:hypothetical protein
MLYKTHSVIKRNGFFVAKVANLQHVCFKLRTPIPTVGNLDSPQCLLVLSLVPERGTLRIQIVRHNLSWFLLLVRPAHHCAAYRTTAKNESKIKA